MKRSILFISILLLCSAAFAQTNYSKETLDKIKEIENNVTGNIILNNEPAGTIAERMAKYHVKGLSVAVIRDYKIEWAKGYGWADEENKIPVTTSTLFEPGSISKTLNALGILKLAQEKKLDLYTDINTYLTSWKFPYDSISKGKKITLADILSHNAGLSVHGFPGHNINGPVPTVLQVLNGEYPAVTPAVRSVFEPGIKFEYSGGGTTISQLLLTDVTKQDYATWMYENVLKPIGMVNSSYAQPPAKDRQRLCASAYYSDGSPVLNKFHVYPEQAAAGLWMTPSDLCNYIIDMQLANKGGASKVLNADMVKLHLSPYNNGPSSFGAFIDDRNGTKYFEHGAGNDGFCGQFYASLEGGYGVAIFCNDEDGTLLYEFLNSIAKAYGWNFYNEPQRKNTDKVISVSKDILKTYEGIYLYDDSWAAVGKKDGDYRFYTYGTYADMYFTSPTAFFNREFQAVKEFMKDDKGNITGYSRMVDGKKFPDAVKVTNPDTLKTTSKIFGSICWYLFENKRYDEALVYYKRAVQLYPNDLTMQLNMAHSYLFNKDYKNAMAIYKAYLKDTINLEPGTISFVNQLQNDFMYFKDHHFDAQVFDKVFEELKIERPKGY